MKCCTRCKETRPLSDFHKSSLTRDGYDYACKLCAAADAARPEARAQRAAYAKTPKGRTAQRRARLKYKYGLTLEEYNELAGQQAGRCAVCGKAARLYIDHDHRCCPGQKTCGACVRGLLCDNCNKGIGNLQDDPLVLRSAAEYLEQHGDGER